MTGPTSSADWVFTNHDEEQSDQRPELRQFFCMFCYQRLPYIGTRNYMTLPVAFRAGKTEAEIANLRPATETQSLINDISDYNTLSHKIVCYCEVTQNQSQNLLIPTRTLFAHNNTWKKVYN